jgi:hypothetical protein
LKTKTKLNEERITELTQVPYEEPQANEEDIKE